MIYRAEWADGRELLLRAPDEESARKNAVLWRLGDAELETSKYATPTRISQVTSRGPVEILSIGWNQNP